MYRKKSIATKHYTKTALCKTVPTFKHTLQYNNELEQHTTRNSVYIYLKLYYKVVLHFYFLLYYKLYETYLVSLFQKLKVLWGYSRKIT